MRQTRTVCGLGSESKLLHTANCVCRTTWVICVCICALSPCKNAIWAITLKKSTEPGTYRRCVQSIHRNERLWRNADMGSEKFNVQRSLRQGGAKGGVCGNRKAGLILCFRKVCRRTWGGVRRETGLDCSENQNCWTFKNADIFLFLLNLYFCLIWKQLFYVTEICYKWNMLSTEFSPCVTACCCFLIKCLWQIWSKHNTETSVLSQKLEGTWRSHQWGDPWVLKSPAA